MIEDPSAVRPESNTWLSSANVRWGAWLGFKYAIAYSAFGVLAFAINGERLTSKYHTTLIAVIAGYLAAGVLGGALVGVLRPLTRWSLGYVVIGVVTGILACAALGVSTFGLPWHWDAETALGIVLAGVLIGGVLGTVTRRQRTVG